MKKQHLPFATSGTKVLPAHQNEWQQPSTDRNLRYHITHRIVWLEKSIAGHYQHQTEPDPA